MLEKFSESYKPTGTRTVATEQLLNDYTNKVPQSLLELWKLNGFGKYNDGLIELVDPQNYAQVLSTWLGKEVPNYVPFAISGFGELFYYRKLNEEDEDVCMIDIQYRKIETLVWSLTSFFEDFITDETVKIDYFRAETFAEATKIHGKLANDEIFTFVPILAWGGAAEVNFIKKGNAAVYQELVFTMTS